MKAVQDFWNSLEYNKLQGQEELRIDKYEKTYTYIGKDFAECTSKVESARIFDSMTIYEAESEIEVLFG